MGRTLLWPFLSLAITVGVTGLLWLLIGPYAFFGFLFLPFLYGLWGRGRAEPPVGPTGVRSCPRCGLSTTDARDEYCPRDGTRLE